MAQLNAIVVGAGIAGLTCAISLARHSGVQVTVFERSPILNDAGNGIQVPCNAGNVLRHLGLLDKLLDRTGGAASASLSVDYRDGKTLLARDYARCQEVYGAPWILAHRADYITVLLDEAQRQGIVIRLGCEIEHVDFTAPSLRLVTGETHGADVIIACDGLHSSIRTQLHPGTLAVPSGSYAYRVLFTPTQLSSPTLRHITSSRSCRLWLGPLIHAVFYPVRSGAAFNLVVIVADAQLNERCEGVHALRHVSEAMRDWDPVVKEMLLTATTLMRFPLMELGELPSWGKGYVTLAGDAAHPTLPYLGQGAAMAVEDALILGTLLGQLTEHLSPSCPVKPHVPTVLNAYASIQRPRTATIVSHSRLQGMFNHFPPGTPAQWERDAEYAAFDMESCVSFSPWVDAAFNRLVLGYKAGDVAMAVFRRLVKQGAFDDGAVDASADNVSGKLWVRHGVKGF